MIQDIEKPSLRVPPLSFATVLLFCIILTTPALVKIGTEMVILTTAIWLYVFFTRYNTIRNGAKKLILLSLCYLLIIIFYKLCGVSTASWEYAAGYAGWIVAEIIGIYLASNASERQNQKLFWVIAISEVANVTYIAVAGTRSIRTAGQIAGVEMTTAMFSTAFMLFSGVLLILLLHTKRTILKSVAFFSIIAVLYVNFSVLQRGINAILTLAMFALIVLFNTKRSRRAYGICFLMGFIILCAYLSGLYIPALQWVESIIPSERIASRIHSINLLLQTNDYIYAGTSVRTRGILINNTWTTFTSSAGNILLGVGDHRSSNAIIGNHNELIDSLARYGVLISLLLYRLVRRQALFLKSLFSATKNNSVYHQAMVVFITYLARNIMGNAFSTAVGIVMFVFLPCVIKLINHENKVNYQKK